MPAKKGQAFASDARSGSPLRAYQDLIVGSRSWGRLLHYELVAAWGSILPGAAGMALRKWFWPGLFGRTGRWTAWGRNVVLRHPGKMWIGDGLIIDDDCYLDARGCGIGEFRIDEGVLVSRGCILGAKDGPLQIGARANIGARCVLYSCGGLEIGRDTMLAADCYIGGGRYDPRGPMEAPLSERPLPGRGVVIEEGCWLGAGVVVIDGVRIGKRSVIGAGAVVTRDVPAGAIAGGVPARALSPGLNGLAKER